MCRALYAAEPGKYVVPAGANIIGTGSTFTHLTACKRPGASEDDGFALIFSMCHAVVDGHSYYDVFRMLEPGAEVLTLSPARNMQFSEAMRDMVGREEMQFGQTCDSTCLLMCLYPNMLGCPCGGPGESTCYGFYVDPERVAAFKQKAAEEAGVEYVSTNDLLTSGFFRACGTRVGFMGFDCRGRMEGITQDLAGNYVTALVLDPTTFKTPGTLRKVLASPPYKTTGEPLPTCCGNFCGEDASLAMVTNWSSFAGNLLQFPGCELALHLPVQNPEQAFELCIPFMVSPGQLAVMCWCCKADEAKLRELLPVGDRLPRDLFP